MNKEQAFSILEKALNVANQKGTFLLADSAVIVSALQVVRGELEIPLPDAPTSPPVEGKGPIELPTAGKS